MGITSRTYLFLDTGEIRKVSTRLVDLLIQGEDALPEFAGTKQRALLVRLENEDRRPARILDAEGGIWHFDAEGKIDDALRQGAAEALAHYRAQQRKEGPVVDLSPAIRKKKHEEKYRWEPSAEDLDRVAADIWPSGQSPERIRNVRGAKPKRPPRTHDAIVAVNGIQIKLFELVNEFDELKEPALKSIAYEARERSSEGELGRFWLGVADAAEQRIEIARRHRTGKGKWVAVVDVVMWDRDRRSGETVDYVHEVCDGRSAAVAAARRLLVEYARCFDTHVSLEVEVLTDLEWNSGAERAANLSSRTLSASRNEL